MPTITCSKCSAGIEVENSQGDLSTYVCKVCQEAVNQPAYKAEMVELQEKSERTESENRRVEFLKAKISGETPEAVEAEGK